MAELKLMSADSHVNEPGDLWTERIDKQLRDRAPRVVENPPGQKPGAYLVLEGIAPVYLAQGMGAGKKPEELRGFFQSLTYKSGRPGGWDPAERVKDMDLDGVEADVIYTTLGFRQFWFTDAALQRACFRVYNDWLAEYCAYAPKRLAGLGLISLWDVDAGVKELERARGSGSSRRRTRSAGCPFSSRSWTRRRRSTCISIRRRSRSSRPSISAARSSPRSSTVASAWRAASSSGWRTSCGPPITRTPCRPGRIPARSSSGTSRMSPRTRSDRSCGTTRPGSTA